MPLSVLKANEVPHILFLELLRYADLRQTIFLSKVNFLNYYRRTFQIQAHEHSIPGRRFASGIDKISVKTKEKAKAIADKKRPI